MFPLFYWCGENKSDTTSNAMVGVMCYSSDNLTAGRTTQPVPSYRAASSNARRLSTIDRGESTSCASIIVNQKWTAKNPLILYIEHRGTEARRNKYIEKVKTIEPDFYSVNSVLSKNKALCLCVSVFHSIFRKPILFYYNTNTCVNRYTYLHFSYLWGLK